MPRLDRFFVFNPTLCEKEGEELNKILYYHPKSREHNDQIKDVGLVEALIKFARTFDTDATAVHGMQTLYSHQIFLEPEQDYILVMIISTEACKQDGSACAEESVGDSANVQAASHLSQLDSECSLEAVYRSRLQRVYQMYRMLHGPLTAATSIDKLRNSLSSFFDSCLSLLDIGSCDILTVLGGVQFLSLEPHLYAQVLSLVNQLQTSFADLQQVLVYYDTRLIWSGLSTDNLSDVHHYLCTALFPECDSTSSSTATPTSSTPARAKGFFMSTEPANPLLCSSKNTIVPPVVRLRKHKFGMSPLDGAVNTSTEEVLLKLVIYRYDKFVLALFVSADLATTSGWCSSLDDWLSLRLQPLADKITRLMTSRNHANQTTPVVDFASGTVNEAAENTKYVYFNGCNLALQSSMHDSDRCGMRPAACLPAEVTDLLPALRTDLTRLSSCDGRFAGGEISAKLSRDYWLAGRVTPTRELYIATHNKQASLIDLWDNFDRICSTQFGEVFFPP